MKGTRLGLEGQGEGAWLKQNSALEAGRSKGGPAWPQSNPVGGEGVAFLRPSLQGLGFGNLARERMAILMAITSPPPNFPAYGEPHKPGVMALWAAFGLWVEIEHLLL